MPRRKRNTDDNNEDLLGEENSLLNLPRYLGDPNADEENLDLLGEEDEEFDEDENFLQLQSQFESLQGQFAQNTEFTNNLLMQLAANNNGGNSNSNGAPEEINFDDLPDPVENREGFNKELGVRMKKMLDTAQQRTSQATQYDSQLANLESSFRRDYEDLATKPALFQSVMTQQVNKIRSSGVDPRQVVFARPEKFLKDVAAQMYDELGIDPEDLDDDDDSELKGGATRKGKRKLQVRRKPANRTRGLGKPSGDINAKGRRGEDKNKKAKSFTDQLKQTQLDNGLI